MFASVVVPTRRRPELLLRALGSLIAQDLPDWEAVVVDDGEGEGIASAKRLGDRRIKAFASSGVGQVDARIAAVESARGDCVCWLDDDDWWEDPAHLSLLRTTLAKGPALCFRGGWIVHEDKPGAPREVFDHDATPESLRRNNTVLTSSIAYPRALHDRLGPLDRTLGGYCDWDFMLRCCAAGIPLVKLPGLGICYSVRKDAASAAVEAPDRLAGFHRFAAKHALDIVIANHAIIHRLLTDDSATWQEKGGALEREFEFPSFADAIGFVNRVAELAEAESHHPDIAVSYRRVTLRWTTHSAGGITDRDRALAERSASLA